MLKLTIAVLAVVLAGAAAADEPSSLRVDASSARAFKRSLAAFKEELSLERRRAFGDALTDIWIAGTQAAEGEGRKYRAKDYYRQIDGLGYDEVVALTTGESARLRELIPNPAVTAQLPPPRRAARPGNTYEQPSPWAQMNFPGPLVEGQGAGGGITLHGTERPPL